MNNLTAGRLDRMATTYLHGRYWMGLLQTDRRDCAESRLQWEHGGFFAGGDRIVSSGQVFDQYPDTGGSGRVDLIRAMGQSYLDQQRTADFLEVSDDAATALTHKCVCFPSRPFETSELCRHMLTEYIGRRSLSRLMRG